MNDLPESSAAFIVHADGSLEMRFPKEDDPDALLPPNVMLIAAIGAKAMDEAWRHDIVSDFISRAERDETAPGMQ